MPFPRLSFLFLPFPPPSAGFRSPANLVIFIFQIANLQSGSISLTPFSHFFFFSRKFTAARVYLLCQSASVAVTALSTLRLSAAAPLTLLRSVFVWMAIALLSFFFLIFAPKYAHIMLLCTDRRTVRTYVFNRSLSRWVQNPHKICSSGRVRLFVCFPH